MEEKILVTNISEIEPNHKAEHERYEYFKYEVTARDKFNQAYCCVYKIPPKKANYPYHTHTKNTEVFYIISGEGILETPDGERKVSLGDIIVCPPSKTEAHRLTNSSDSEMLVYLDVDTQNSPDILHYPETGKTGIIIQNDSARFFKDNTEVDYFEGEK